MTDQVPSVESVQSLSLEEENQRLRLQLLEEKHKMEIAMISKEYEEKITFLENELKSQQDFFKIYYQGIENCLLDAKRRREESSCVIA